MAADSFEMRRKGLEEGFFARENQRVLEKFREKVQHEKIKQSLAKLSGISDQATLDALVAANISAEALAALLLVPLIEVAWCDGDLAIEEREAVLKAANVRGLHAGEPAFDVLEGWLKQKPQADLFVAWKSYVAELKSQLDAGVYSKLRDELVRGAEEVAAAAGGFLGLVSNVSAEEKNTLARIKNSFL